MSSPKVSIAFGNKEGSSELHWNTLTGLAQDLTDVCPEITNLTLWYDKQQDFHHLSFNLDGDHYDIRYYKIFVVTKNDWDTFLNRNLFGRSSFSLIDFFRNGKHREWNFIPEYS